MKKLILSLDKLAVESFATDAERDVARDAQGGVYAQHSLDKSCRITCEATCETWWCAC